MNKAIVQNNNGIEFLDFGWEAQAKMGLQQLKQEISILHDLFDQLLTSTKPREALKVLSSCFDIIENSKYLFTLFIYDIDN